MSQYGTVLIPYIATSIKMNIFNDMIIPQKRHLSRPLAKSKSSQNLILHHFYYMLSKLNRYTLILKVLKSNE